MNIVQLHTSKMQTNTYVVLNGDRAFVVDAGGDARKIKAVLDANGARLEAILLTHAHFDHIGGVAELLRLADDNGSVAVLLHREDADKITSYKNMGFAVGERVEPFVPDILLNDGKRITVAGVRIKILHTPGHTRGGVCYVAEDRIFSGDTLFYTSYGRTDFYDGSFAEIKNSIVNKLFRLRGDYTVLPGHGEPTTLDFERKNNMIIYD